MTGTSTGIGLAITHELAHAGHPVFAGVRSPEAAARVASIHDRVKPVQVDVTQPDQIAAARAFVEGETGARGLGALVNNAGIGGPAPIETTRIDDLRDQFEVNVFGAVALTQALLPSLRANQGRIVNITSVAGELALPGFAGYAGSKHAMEAISDVLRRELRPDGVDVVVVQPGTVQSAMWDKGYTHIGDERERLGDLSGRYEPMMMAIEAGMRQGQQNAVTAEHVARKVRRALTARWPRRRYRVGPDAHVLLALNRWLPEWALDFLVARLL